MAGKTKQTTLKGLRVLLTDYVFAVAAAAVLALVLRVWVIEAFRIPTDLMAPTLLGGDHIFVNKQAYGDKFWSDGLEPERGDVVVFSFPNNPAKDYIKRVIAVGGDRVELRDGVVFVNGRALSKGLEKGDLAEEEIDGRRYSVRWGAETDGRNMMPVAVPKGQLFMLGDHRTEGQDSRSWGFLPATYVKGRATIIWFSSGRDAPEKGWAVRWQRLLKRVD